MNSLLQFDNFLTLIINGGHTPILDQFFYNFSEKWIWIPLYIAILFVVFRKEGRQAWWIVLSLALVVLLSDQLSSSILKPLVERLRPSHDLSISSQIHLVNGYSGGLYGFVSSHAANTVAVALFLSLIFKNTTISTLFVIWAFLTAYSRVYLGVHFVGDVFCGSLIGLFFAWIAFGLYRRFKEPRSEIGVYSSKDILPIAVVFALTLVLVMIKPI